MNALSAEDCLLVTGARGHVGSELCRLLTSQNIKFVPVDSQPGGTQGLLRCDLTVRQEVTQLFQTHSIQGVIHLAGMLPGAFQADPLCGADVNLGGSLNLMREAVNAKVKRFVFASSMSVYGSSAGTRAVNEDDPAAPDEPYGACKRAVELIGSKLAETGAMEFVALRIARVVGPGIRKTSSPWRSQIFDALSTHNPVHIPFGPGELLSVVHVHEVARMLVTLAHAARVTKTVYNSPVEVWETKKLKQLLEQTKGISVELRRDGAGAGPVCDGRKFAQEFAFQLRGLRDYLVERKRC